jgi:hypothetical protein
LGFLYHESFLAGGKEVNAILQALQKVIPFLDHFCSAAVWKNEPAILVAFQVPS